MKPKQKQRCLALSAYQTGRIMWLFPCRWELRKKVGRIIPCLPFWKTFLCSSRGDQLACTSFIPSTWMCENRTATNNLGTYRTEGKCKLHFSFAICNSAENIKTSYLRMTSDGKSSCVIQESSLSSLSLLTSSSSTSLSAITTTSGEHLTHWRLGQEQKSTHIQNIQDFRM